MSWFRRKEQDSGLPQGSQHNTSADDRAANPPPRNGMMLSPERPPPIHNVFHQQHHSKNSPLKSDVGAAPPILPPPLSPSYHTHSQNQSSTIADLTKRRPIDPVFRSSEKQAHATVPRMNGMPYQQQQQQQLQPNVKVFDPSSMTKQAADTAGANDDGNPSKHEEDDADIDEILDRLNEDFAVDEVERETQEHKEDKVVDHKSPDDDDDDYYHRERPVQPMPFEDIDRLKEDFEDEHSCNPEVEHAFQNRTEESVHTNEPELISRETDNRQKDTAEDLIESSTDPSSTPFLETPTNRRIKPSRFVFLSDQKSVPNDMKRLQEHTIKRRRELLARMHDIDCQVARLMAKFANEKMDMELAICDTFERTVANPLASAVERMAIQREASTSRMVGVANLERRLTYLDAQMIHHINVTLNDIKRDELESFHDELQQDLISEIRVETTKYDKVEAGIVRRFELVAGEIAKNFHKEGAARRAELGLLKNKIDTTIPQQQTDRLENTLSQIAQLRAKLRQERADRQAADAAILESIVATTGTIKRAMMALVSDGENQQV
ncbi:hypothetical protein IV203_035039 [Nitzschia inconspicua]|uniref:Uncharacterized protein n=1 Tax=Nitzschia inconspicua TaxID=303405 RepID=A0A9K3LFJ4_9STRA|nr:hypothetical protein IV203_035039 [Nitzschia inconspicua]